MKIGTQIYFQMHFQTQCKFLISSVHTGHKEILGRSCLPVCNLVFETAQFIQ